VAYGGFADVWEGALGDEKVCVKVLRMYNVNKSNQKGPLVVCGICEPLVCSVDADIIQVFSRGSGRLEETEASKCRAILGCYDDAATARLEVDAQWNPDGICQRQSRCGQNKPRT